MSNITIYTDGGARGNPGPAAIGAVIDGLSSGRKALGEYIGEATNNVAEYRALIMALSYLKDSGEKIDSVVCYADSELMVEQLNGGYKIKNTAIRGFFMEIQVLKSDLIVPITFHHIPRAKNAEADEIVNHVLDKKLGKKAI